MRAVDWLGRVAEAMGCARPSGALAVALEAALPDGDPRLADNWLAPGGLPLELSFSEREPERLRFVFEPAGPGASPADRWRAAWALVPGEDTLGPPEAGNYGAAVGAVLGPDGVEGWKLYAEDRGAALSPPLARVVERARRACPGLTPLFVSQEWRGEASAERAYLSAEAGLSLFEVDALARRLGHSGADAAALVAALRPLCGGRFRTPPSRTVLGLRLRPDGNVALKVDLLLDALGTPSPAEAHVDAWLQGRTGAAWTAFLRALAHPAFTGGVGALGVGIRPGEGPRHSVYWRPRPA